MPHRSEPDSCALPSVACGHQFRDVSLLEAALTHPSSTDPKQSDIRLRYQRLEFLGDVVWSLVVSDALMTLCPSASEGELTMRRAGLIRASSLAHMGKVLGLSSLLILSKGEEAAGGRNRVSILSSAFEAVIGAIYLDGGLAEIHRLAREACREQLSEKRVPHDPKSRLQEVTQFRFTATPRYRMLRRKGPPHAPAFEVEVTIGRSVIGYGRGRTKREAERAAATAALATFSAESHTTSGGHS